MDFSRRHFFFGSALAGAVPAFGFGSTPSLKFAGYKSPNEKLNFAAIGSGGQGASNIGAAAPTENIVALCDVDDRRAATTFKRFPNAPKYRDFRQMLDKEGKNIDAVIVATPDHMHATAAMWCMERGKHVYVQKPLVRTIWEARQLREAANKYRVATQMGNQGYSNEGTRQCAEIIWSGEIGNVTEVHAWSDRPLWPQGLTEIPPRRPGSVDARLGPVARRRREASVHRRRQDRARPVGRLLLPAVQLARLLRFRLRRAGRHGVPHPGRAEHGAAPVEAEDRGRRVHQEGRRQPVPVPQGVGHPLRFRGVWRHARAEDLLVRRAEGEPDDSGRSRRRMDRRSAVADGRERTGGGRGHGRRPGGPRIRRPATRYDVPLTGPRLQLGRSSKP